MRVPGSMDGMSRKLLVLAAFVVVVGAVGFGAFWYSFLRDDSPPEVSLEAAVTAVAGTPQATVAPNNLSGTWTVQNGPNSFAGYRVNENLVGFGSRTAVGRTQSVVGSFSYDGADVSSVRVTADLTSLKSDQSLRDETLHQQAIQSCQFPTAVFELSTPINIGTPGSTAITKTVQGKLTLHGVTKDVSIDVKGQLVNSQVVIVGSTKISFADYNISQPRSLYVVSLDDFGVMEFQLTFAKSATSATPAATPAGTPTPIPGCSGGPPGPPPGVTPGSGRPPGGPPPGGPGGFPPINTPAPVPSPVG